MNTKLINLFIGFFFISNMSFADSPIGKYLSKIKIFDNKDGRKIETYQDVVINLNPFQERNSDYPIISESEIPEDFVKKSEAKKIFKKFSSNVIITEEKLSFEDFMRDNFYLKNESGSEEISDFPYNLSVSPANNKLYLCLRDNYKYVTDFSEYPPDALSCSACPSLCSKKCKIKKVKVKKVIRHWWYDDIVINEDKDKKVHAFGEKNIYKDFRTTIYSKSNIINAEEYQNNNNYIEINIKDRVPPNLIKGYPELGNDPNNLCTSGDYYKSENIEIQDDIAKVVYAKFAFGKINDSPTPNEKWINQENWSESENIVEINNNEESDFSANNYFSDVIKLSPVNGYLRYSIFSKEDGPNGEGNVNPGIKHIEFGQPEIGYGYPLADDLGNTEETAKDWPDKRNLSDIREKGYETGFIKIIDNDRPNILIRITNVETGEQLFFPPCDNSNKVKISNSSIYKAISGEGRTNKDDYEYFTENLTSEYDYNSIINNSKSNPYYTIYSIETSEIKTEEETSLIEKLLLNKDSNFISENLRLEDYYYSDNESDGSKPFSNNNKIPMGALGKRNGTFAKMIALLENSGSFHIKSGIKYKLDVWTDDNVKWTNIDSVNTQNSNSENIDFTNESNILDEAKIYDTGIKTGVISLDLRNGSAESFLEEKIDTKKAINGDIYFTLNEETPSKHDIKSVEELDENNFPSISVIAEDYSGLQRELKLYFRVNDKKLNLKTLD